MVTFLGRLGTYLLSLGAILISLVLTTNLKPSAAIEFLITAFKPFIKIMAEIPEIFKESKQSAKSQKPRENRKIIEKTEPKVHKPFLTPLERKEISKALDIEDDITEDPLQPSFRSINKYKTSSDSHQAESAKDAEE